MIGTAPLLIFDEMITGFRWPKCSAQRYHEVEADLSTFGKALGNGIAISALVGRSDIMNSAASIMIETVSLLSTTHGAETHALAAALAVMDTYRDRPVIETLHRQETAGAGVEASARRRGLANHFKLAGRTSNLIYTCLDGGGAPSQIFRALFLQETIRRGLPAPSLVVSYSHSDDDIDQTIEAIDGALDVYLEGAGRRTGSPSDRSTGSTPYSVGEPIQFCSRHAKC